MKLEAEVKPKEVTKESTKNDLKETPKEPKDADTLTFEGKLIVVINLSKV